MKAVWMTLLMTACKPLLQQPVPLAPDAIVTLRVPGDAYTISEAIAAGATVVEVGVGEFDLGILHLAALSYRISGSGIGRTKLRTADITPFTGADGSSLTFSDLTLEELGPKFMSYNNGFFNLRRIGLIGELRTSGAAVDIADSNVKGGINVTDGSLDIEQSTIDLIRELRTSAAVVNIADSNVQGGINVTDGSLHIERSTISLIGELRTSAAAVDIEDSVVKGGITVIDRSLNIVRSTISAGPSVLAAVEATASLDGKLEVKIRDTLLEAAPVGFGTRATLGTVNASLERVAVTSSEYGASLVCLARGRYNVTLDHSVFYRNRFAVVAHAKIDSSGARWRWADVPVRDVPMRDVPMRDVPVRDVPVGDVPVGPPGGSSPCGELTIRNSMFVENRGRAVELHGAKVVASHNFSWQNAGGNYWIPRSPFHEVDPMFVDPVHGDFRLQAGSPAIAAGAEVVDRGARARSDFAVAREIEIDSPFKAAGPVSVGPPAAKGGRNLALVVGVQHYQDPAIKDLKYARSDAESIAQYLRKAGYTVNLLTEAAASVTAVKAALINLTRAGPGDSVLIYFSVHGSGESNPLGAGRGFLLLSDAQASSIPSTSLSVQEIQAAVDRTASERVVLIMDSCFSGGASAQAKSIWTADNIKGDGESITGSIAYGRGKIGLFSSRDNEVSLEADEFKHGYFTYYLLEAWGRGLRSVDEVYAYVLREVENRTKGQQHPRYSSAQAEGQAPTF